MTCWLGQAPLRWPRNWLGHVKQNLSPTLCILAAASVSPMAQKLNRPCEVKTANAISYSNMLVAAEAYLLAQKLNGPHEAKLAIAKFIHRTIYGQIVVKPHQLGLGQLEQFLRPVQCKPCYAVNRWFYPCWCKSIDAKKEWSKPHLCCRYPFLAEHLRIALYAKFKEPMCGYQKDFVLLELGLNVRVCIPIGLSLIRLENQEAPHICPNCYQGYPFSVTATNPMEQPGRVCPIQGYVWSQTIAKGPQPIAKYDRQLQLSMINHIVLPCGNSHLR